MKQVVPRQAQPASPQGRPVKSVVSIVSRVHFVHAGSLFVLLVVLREGLDDTEYHLGLGRLSLHHRNGLVVGELSQIDAVDAQQDIA